MNDRSHCPRCGGHGYTTALPYVVRRDGIDLPVESRLCGPAHRATLGEYAGLPLAELAAAVGRPARLAGGRKAVA